MSDKDSQGEPRQLTVAELLARSGGSTSEQRPPRRHRSIDEGGISVAELTGDLPKVAEKPDESRHSSVPIDDEPAEDSGYRSGYDDDAGDDYDAEYAEDEYDVGEYGDDEYDDGRYGEDEYEDAADYADDYDAPEGAEDEYGNGEYGKDEYAEDEYDDRAGDYDAEYSDAEYDDDYADDEYRDEDEYEAYATGDAAPDSTMVMGAVEDDVHGVDDRDAVAVRAADEELADNDAADAADDDSEGSGVGSVILLAVVGIVVGALVFLGFQQLWESDLARILIAILGLAVTGLFVGVVHALRTTRDGLSMALAGLVGLLMTFGPGIPLLL